ncbi:MAG: butyryl-CoA dehydrogenase [Rhodobacteraceae bacterium HLUCCA12]|nr:MAG: butyryl-CoA dehydrogenase [Rhodobacteraceae bacterium HLUCCA12]
MSISSTVPTMNARDMEFQLFEVLGVEGLTDRPDYAEHDAISLRATLDVARQIAADKFQTHYREADLSEPVLENGKVRLLPQVKEALDAFCEAGFMNADRPLDEGGMSLPFSVYQACLACFQAANVGTSSYNFLTFSGANVIRSFGTEDQKRLYMNPMLEGRFLGTMCLSEPQAGSGLADIRTRAVPQADGSYLLKGSKMWISAGHHELSENIVHLVLARIDGAPPGTRGISLFIVPRRRVEDDGGAGGVTGQDNDISVVGLNHKMGYRATVNALLNFGENDACRAELLGEPNKGLSHMFFMMNEARISVGVGAAMLGVAGHLYSREYALTRHQGRHPGAKDPALPPVPIIEHADVRRMLLTQKSYAEGALALCLYAATLVDDMRTAETGAAREHASLLLEFLTPIVKSWPSEFCLEANKLAIQVLGGYGYTRDYPVEQFYRDNRLNMIHEGTNGIQAVDLVGRKIRLKDGAALEAVLSEIEAEIGAGHGTRTAGHARQLERAIGDVRACSNALRQLDDDMRLQTANAPYYLDMLGHVIVAWMWLRQARVAAAALTAGVSEAEESFYEGKLAACRYFFEYELGRTEHWGRILTSQNDLFLRVHSDWC